MLRYKIDVLMELKNRGYNTNRIRKEKIFAEATLQKFRNGQIISADNLDRLCRTLECQPGDILEYVSDE
ncbi:MAG: helix-turn-helix domain-containing protein [Ruminococcus sp.]|nr:helix-turn-helix domain-containing protein [Ruminococcus sp.]